MGGGGDMSIFEYFLTDSLATFAWTTQKYSQINHSKITQKLLKKNSIFKSMTLLILRSCSVQSFSDAMETGGYTFY